MRSFSVRSVYLFVSLAIFASLAVFSFVNVNSSYAVVATMRERGSSDLPTRAPRKPSTALAPAIPIAVPRRHSSSSSSPSSPVKVVPNRKKLPSVSKRIPVSPPDDVPTFVVTCGSGDSDAVDEMKPLLKSILMMISQPVHFVFLTDPSGGKRIHRLFNHLAWTKRQVWVDIHVLNERLVDKWAAKVRMSVWSHSSGRWGTAKLMIPWIIQDRERAIIVDTDMIFMQDPMNLWELFSTGSQDWIYQMPIARMTSPIYICSCIMLLKLRRIREHQVYPNLMRFALEQAPTWYDPEIKLYKPNTGDQGVYFQLIKHYTKLFKRLPVHWARGHCGKYQDALKVQSKLPVGVLHRNCASTNSSRFQDEASTYFDFFSHYRWHWLRPVHGVKRPIKVRSFGVRPAQIGL